MTCTFDRELLALYTNDDATSIEREAVEAHLTECTACMGIVAQYRQLTAELRGAVTSPLPSTDASTFSERPRRRWWIATTAAAVVLLLFGALQVPAVAAQVARLYPFMVIFEMDRDEVLAFLKRFNEDSRQPGKVYRPETFQTISEAETAWGGVIPQPSALPAGMVLYRIDLFRWESGQKEVTLRYRNEQHGGNLNLRLSTRKQERKVPGGATSETLVNGEKAVVIKGTFGQYPGEPLKWEPDSDMHLFFPLGALYADLYIAGPGGAIEELVRVAESIR